MKYRTELDSMGPIKVPSDALWGAQTQRAIDNFRISRSRMPEALILALAIIKEQAAVSNKRLRLLDPKIADSIIRAASEIASGLHREQFPVDIFQTGSGTSTNMNMNEVIANRASQIYGKKLGNRTIHPNDHVNLCQSSNDVFPSSIHIAAAIEIDSKLIPALINIKGKLEKKAVEFDDVIKIGRTHLQDALPIRLGQEFSAYAALISRSIESMRSAYDKLLELPLGGTAIGSGVNAHKDFASLTIDGISKKTGIGFRQAPNLFEAVSARGALVRLSSSLKEAAVNISKIANDLRWLSAGPRGGISEINIPELQPGSSIMPGKINPVMPEMLLQVCAQTIANDLAVSLGGLGGNFELNTMMPLIAKNTLESIEIMSNAVNAFSEKCVKGIKANRERCNKLVEQSLMLGTVLTRDLGYDTVAEIAKEAYATGRSIRDIVIRRRLLTPGELDKLLNLREMTGKQR